MADLPTGYQFSKHNDMSNEKNTSENQQGHAPLAGVVLSPGLEYPDTPGKWRMEEYYQMAIEAVFGRKTLIITQMYMRVNKHRIEQMTALFNR